MELYTARSVLLSPHAKSRPVPEPWAVAPAPVPALHGLRAVASDLLIAWRRIWM